MAGWGEKFNKVTLSAISKGKEVAGITKLNMEISSLNQALKEAQAQVGAYVMEQELFAEDETVAQLCEKARKVQADIAADQEKLKALKNVQICPACGAEVPRTCQADVGQDPVGGSDAGARRSSARGNGDVMRDLVYGRDIWNAVIYKRLFAEKPKALCRMRFRFFWEKEKVCCRRGVQMIYMRNEHEEIMEKTEVARLWNFCCCSRSGSSDRAVHISESVG